MLEVKDLVAGYGAIEVLKGISLKVKEGEKVTVIGPNGSGKTTLVKVISGLLKPIRGSVLLFNKDITKLSPHAISRAGVKMVPEGGRVFPRLTVMENILMGIPSIKDYENGIKKVFEIFPILKERKNQIAGTLSGGEQRMLSLARALVCEPKLLILDELSLGLAPKVITTLYHVLEDLHKEMKLTILLIEQYVKRALMFTDRAYLLENGIIKIEGKSSELLENSEIKRTYLGLH